MIYDNVIDNHSDKQSSTRELEHWPGNRAALSEPALFLRAGHIAGFGFTFPACVEASLRSFVAGDSVVKVGMIELFELCECL